MNARGARRGAPGKKKDLSYPRRPWLTALWIPAGALLLPVGGALMAFGWWGLLGLALYGTGAIGLLTATIALSPSGLLRIVALTLMFAPLLVVPTMSMGSADAFVLQARGTPHPGLVTRVTEVGGKTTHYYCTVHYTAVPARTDRIECTRSSTAGERVTVIEDPQGWVDPEFSGAVTLAAFDRWFALSADAALAAVATASALIGTVIMLVRRRRPAATAS